jgi:hypothetical protein
MMARSRLAHIVKREPWPVAVGAREAVVDVDAAVTDAQSG